MHHRIRILVLASCYLPGFKAGGPIRSLSNMINALGDEFEFRVLTGDRDLGDTAPYPGITPGAWVPARQEKVMYLPPELTKLGCIERIVSDTPHDLVYLGGAFDPVFVLRFLMLRRLGRVDDSPVILAPQGVFSQGALRIKTLKKRLFLAIARKLGLYEGLAWHVSTPFEQRDVIEALRLRGNSHVMVVARNVTDALDDPPPRPRRKSPQRLQVVFLSRISPKKNLVGALRVLQGVDIPVDFDIYGPAEDRPYWRLCEQEMNRLPANVKATYHGAVAHRDVAAVMRSHDLFFLPTLGENFGHVIIEALREGCPALIADNTAFRNLEQRHAGWDLPPDDVAGFRRVLQKCAAMSNEERLSWSSGARQLAVETITNHETLDVYRAAFREIAAKSGAARAA